MQKTRILAAFAAFAIVAIAATLTTVTVTVPTVAAEPAFLGIYPDQVQSIDQEQLVVAAAHGQFSLGKYNDPYFLGIYPDSIPGLDQEQLALAIALGQVSLASDHDKIVLTHQAPVFKVKRDVLNTLDREQVEEAAEAGTLTILD